MTIKDALDKVNSGRWQVPAEGKQVADAYQDGTLDDCSMLNVIAFLLGEVNKLTDGGHTTDGPTARMVR